MHDDQDGSLAARVRAMTPMIGPWWQRIRALMTWAGPWVRRRLQTPEARDQARRERVAAWRAAVDRDDFSPRQFADSNAYATLRGHLPADLREEIDWWRQPNTFGVSPSGGRRYPMQSRLLIEIARIEQEWGLI